MITLKHVYYEIHDEVSSNDNVHYCFIKNLNVKSSIFDRIQEFTRGGRPVTTISRPSHILLILSNPCNMESVARTWYCCGLLPLVHRSKQNMHNYAGPVDFLFSYYSVEIDCTSRFQAHCLSTKQLICYILYYYT